MSCLLALGFFTPAEIQYPIADVALAQPLLQKAWERADHRAAFEIERRWPGVFPAFRLTAKKGEVDLIVLTGNSDRALTIGPGHLPSSALPGEVGNTVITGRHDFFSRFLGTLEVDVLFLFPVGGQPDARRSSVVLDTPQSMLSLVTGYPFGPAETTDALSFVVTARMLF